MMSRRWLGGPKPPKNPHSLEHLKYLHYVLTKNSTVTEGNKALIVEALRSMSEILIWGDQNDSSVFEFYLEKNMFLFFLNILGQNAGNYVCVQLLQTLNILFENLQNDTSLYYLLSNNHVNEVICHKFDFSDEEVLAYYISFLKTLSLKLNKHTIHFFYNEHTDDFALYTEAIKFFNHSESMVRIAVRTLTLNVYKVEEEAMLRYIRDRTAVPYFSNLVWFIGNHVRQLNACVRNNDNHEHRNRLDVLVAEHLDHLHYLNDILSIRNDLLNGILGEHLLSRLFVPLYIYSLTSMGDEDSDEQEQPKVNSVVALFLLSQVFLIIHYEPLVHKLAEVIFNPTTLLTGDAEKDKLYQVFLTPPESLETLLASKRKKSGRRKKRPNFRNVGSDEEGHSQQTLIEQNYTVEEVEKSSSKHVAIDSPAYSDDSLSYSSSSVLSGGNSSSNEHSDSHAIPPTRNITDEEKAAAAAAASRLSSSSSSISTNRPFLDTIYSALNCKDNDYSALFALCLLYAMQHNKGINSNLKEVIKLGGEITEEESEETYSHWLVERLLRILSTSVRPDSKVRLSTLRLSCLLLKEIGLKNGDCILLENHLNCIEDARNESMECLHTFYKEEEIFLDIFEDEYRTYQNKPLNVEYMMMDHSLLLPPTGTPLTGIDFSNRLPCGPAEKAKRAIGSFISLRDLSLALCKEVETQLPLTRSQDCIQNNDKLDLNNSDLIACTVSSRDGRQRRFLVVDLYQLVLVEPETKRLGWGVVKFAGFLQDVEVTSDNEDSRVLRVTIHKPSGARRLPLLSADFIFDDHIRCMAAKQRLTKGRMRARHLKMQRIAVLIGLPENAVEDPFANNYMLNTGFQASRSQFHAYAEPQAVEVSSGIRSSHAPQPILKRPGRAATSVSPGFPGRIGSLGLPTSPRSHPARSSSPALQLPTSKKKSKTKQKKSLPASDSSPDLLLNLPTDGSNIINDLQPVIDGNVITREFIKGHRKTNSGHISSSLLPYEEVGIPVGKLESDTISCGSSASIGNDIKGLEEGVDASSLNEFSIEDDPAKSPQDSVKIPQDSVNVDHMSAEASELSKDNKAEVVFAESLSLDSKSPATTEKLESSHLETDDSKAARLNTDPVNTFSTNFKDLAPALQPPSSAPASLMFQQAPKFDVSISPVRKPSLQIVPTTE